MAQLKTLKFDQLLHNHDKDTHMLAQETNKIMSFAEVAHPLDAVPYMEEPILAQHEDDHDHSEFKEAEPVKAEDNFRA